MEQSLREKKKLITYNQILSSAIELFLEKEFEKVTLDEIAEKAIVSKRTLLRYFSTKDDILIKWMDMQLEELLIELRKNLVDMHPFTALENTLKKLLIDWQSNDIERSKLILRLVYTSPSTRTLRLGKYEKWEIAFSKEIELIMKEDKNKSLRSRMIAARAIDALMFTLDYWLKDEFKTDLNDLLAQSFAVVKESLE